MKQQWQQMTEQQKKLAIVLIAVIVLAVILIAWQLIPRQPSTTTTEVTQQTSGAGFPTHGPGGPATGMPGGGAPGFETSPGMVGQAGAPATAGGLGPMIAGPTPGAPSGPEAAPPTTTPPGKLETPPRPGRPDPFADLPTRKVEPFTPIVLPPTPEPVVISRAPAGSIGTETFSLSEVATNIPTLQAQSVDLRSYFAPPQPITTGRRELPGWRLAGTILTEGSIGAIIQTPDGKSHPVRLGGRITYGGSDYTVVQVDEQKVVLKDSQGEEYTLSRRPRTSIAAPYGGAYVPGGFGQFGPGGWGPGGY